MRASTCLQRPPLPWPLSLLKLSPKLLGPDLIQDWDVGSDEVDYLNRLPIFQSDALEADVPLKLVRQSPAQAIADISPFDPKHKMREQCHLTARRNTAAYPSRRRAIGLLRPRLDGSVAPYRGGITGWQRCREAGLSLVSRRLSNPFKSVRCRNVRDGACHRHKKCALRPFGQRYGKLRSLLALFWLCCLVFCKTATRSSQM